MDCVPTGWRMWQSANHRDMHVARAGGDAGTALYFYDAAAALEERGTAASSIQSNKGLARRIKNSAVTAR